MSARKVMKKGFTLVEILIVVVILGILAAIVIPQFTAASETAQASSAASTLQTVRSQLELYRVQHNGAYPTSAQMWGNLTGKSDRDGTANASGSFGPYLPKAPLNPFTNGSAIGTDWNYDASTGVLKAILPTSITDDEATSLGLDTTNDFMRAGG